MSWLRRQHSFPVAHSLPSPARDSDWANLSKEQTQQKQEPNKIFRSYINPKTLRKDNDRYGVAQSIHGSLQLQNRRQERKSHIRQYSYTCCLLHHDFPWPLLGWLMSFLTLPGRPCWASGQPPAQRKMMQKEHNTSIPISAFFLSILKEYLQECCLLQNFWIMKTETSDGRPFKSYAVVLPWSWLRA